VDFSATVTIGRQGFYVTADELCEALAAHGRSDARATADRLCSESDGFVEPLLRFLGAEVTDSIDHSDFESATFTHDMNAPIGDEFKQRYSTVIDGGTLEHVFNFPTAIRNCMEMVRVGGHYLSITPANNFFGHGFYQFSPELYFRVLSADNGFKVESMLAFEEIENPVWWQVSDPAEIGERVTLLNDRPVFLLIVARRVEEKPIFARTPQQSDYVVRWAPDEASPQPAAATAAPRPLGIRIAKLLLPADVRTAMRKALSRPPQPEVGFSPRFFRPMASPPRRADP